jgi:hypothetical protein
VDISWVTRLVELAGKRQNVELLVAEGMWHGFNWDPVILESIRARAAVIKFLEGAR